ncbi:1-phosphatidylinositol 4,5-bisphosphate phosphodiesterase gamma-1-like isoform X2 [Athalia rosae]|uniref:1-phosphatidylinositol 4,5-bisphosphate phosphodiesterase gamma-1-like isoform X2 n=1 Tax=Athalia rosae TaxID=37344 RepID=UPI00203438A3|nr:1-phosphatidylinositol 4,5-bisphosphate phosphodiesterase gamma-1-like isoform X2 [Athalia rosae]
MERIISDLEEGIHIHKFDLKKNAEETKLIVSRDTKQIIWLKSSPSICRYESAIDLCDIKEIRIGIDPKDLERLPKTKKKLKANRCFVIYYGAEFCLKTVILFASTERDCERWVEGLNYLVQDAVNAPYPVQVKSWLKKHFYSTSDAQGMVTSKTVKDFLSKTNYKIPTDKLSMVFNFFDVKKKHELTFRRFVNLYENVMFDGKDITPWKHLLRYSNDGRIITRQEFQNFLVSEQEEFLNSDVGEVSQYMRNYLQDSQRELSYPYFTLSEFISYLHSKHNEIWDRSNDQVTQDMTKPLSHYWIASSHNTYLNGHQWYGQSSCRAYARVLKSGCRCIELDCWDGPDHKPIIYHGNSITKKVEFSDVIKTIKEYAFVTTDYPLILSIEDHCTVAQQRVMATIMKDVFGDSLLTKCVDENETSLPSPEALRRKILLKHAKLPENSDGVISPPQNDERNEEMDCRRVIKNGLLHLEDPVSKVWKPHFFNLTDKKLYYTDMYLHTMAINQDKEEESTFDDVPENMPQEELHYEEKWFHGTLENERKEAAELLQRYSHLGNGTFLVRQSRSHPGDFGLSLWCNGKPYHCHIQSKTEDGRTKFFLHELHIFDSIYDLIIFYRSHPIKTQAFTITLQDPVPQPSTHVGKNWWHANCNRRKAEKLLSRTHPNGAFLVRPSEMEIGAYAISLKADGEIKHCRITLEGRLCTVGSYRFENLVDLISYFERNPLYKKVRLTHPVICNQYEIVEPEDESNRNVNLRKEKTRSWQGDYMEKSQNEVVGATDSKKDDSEKSFEIRGAEVNLIISSRPGIQFVLTVRNPNVQSECLQISAPSMECAAEWEKSISKVARNISTEQRRKKKMEATWRIAKELSDFIVYCRTVNFDIDRIRKRGFDFREMSSFDDTRAKKLMSHQETKFFLEYHQFQFSRVYPSPILHMDSSNFNPVPLWNSGSQMIALNYQTGDKPMQLNRAKFRENGGCGYVLKPEFMFAEDFNPHDRSALWKMDMMYVDLKIISARHLVKLGKSIASPSVDVEIIGADFDSGIKLTTKTIRDNGLNPVWNESCKFQILNPHFAMLRFLVQDEDAFGDKNFIGQATFPIRTIRTGYRSVPLQNNFSEDIHLASLLVHVKIKYSPKIMHLRTASFTNLVSQSSMNMDNDKEKQAARPKSFNFLGEPKIFFIKEKGKGKGLW